MPHVEHPFRPLSAFERELVRRLLEDPGASSSQKLNALRARLLATLDDARVHTIDVHGCLDFELPEGASRRHVLLAQGRSQDADGFPIEPLLWVTREDHLYMLEMVTYKDSPIAKMPEPRQFSVWLDDEPDTSIPRLRPLCQRST